MFVNLASSNLQYVGESERAVRQVFQRAKYSAPCVVFFDEIDALCPQRTGGSDHSGSNRVVTQLLTEMDGIEGRQGVYIMGATNRENVIDPAIKRPGRLETILYVGLPNMEDRVSILNTITKNKTRPCVAPQVDFTSISKDCDGYSGADLKALVTKASELVFSEGKERQISKRHFDQALKIIKPSVQGKEKLRYEKTRQRLEVHNENQFSGEAMETEENVFSSEQENSSIVSGEKEVVEEKKGDVSEICQKNLNDDDDDDFSDYIPTPTGAISEKGSTNVNGEVSKEKDSTEQKKLKDEPVKSTDNPPTKFNESEPVKQINNTKSGQVNATKKDECKTKEPAKDLTETKDANKKEEKPVQDAKKNGQVSNNGNVGNGASKIDQECSSRFLPDMSIRVKESHKERGGMFGKVVRQDKNTVTIAMKGKSECLVSANDLEPFMPTPGDKAKSMNKAHPETLFEVLEFENDDDCVLVRNLENDDEESLRIEELCRVDK